MAGKTLIRKLLRAFDFAVLASAAALALTAGFAAGCDPRPATLAFVVLALALGIPQGRQTYGSAVEWASLAVAAAASAAVHAATAPGCGDATAFAWLIAASAMALPRIPIALWRRKAVTAFESWTLSPAVGAPSFARTAWILTLSRPVDEPRVRRQAMALHAAGWNVVAIGYKGVAAKPGFWTVVELPRERQRNRSAGRFLLQALNLGKAVDWVVLLLARFSAAQADRFYWSRFDRGIVSDILDAARRHRLGCDLVANHDYFTLPIAAQLSSRLDVPFTTDVHEYARGQYMHERSFRMFYRHYVHTLQTLYLPRAALLTVVCRGIADLLDAEYELRRRSLVVRNVSIYERMPFQPTPATIRVLYHGMLFPTRGLEESIRSVPLWRPEFHLVLRGPGEAAYVESLRRLARELGVESRVTFEAAVPLPNLIAAANRCDIGLFASGDYSPQKRFTAPNKLFEYVMAGLAVCVSDLPEMRSVVEQHQVGKLFAGTAPTAIAQAINAFTRESVDEYKRRSLEAAKTLCWEQEMHALIAAYEDIYRSRAAEKAGAAHPQFSPAAR